MRIRNLIIFFSLSFFVVGCKSFFTESYVKFKSTQPKVELEGYSANGNFFSVDSSSGRYYMTMNSENAYYAFLVTKKGYKPETFICTPDKLNPSRIFGAAAGLVALGLGSFAMVNSPDADMGTTGLLIGAGAIVFLKNVIGGQNSTNYRYQKEFIIPELKDFPKRDSTFPYLYVDTNSLKIPASIVSLQEYDTFKKYRLGNATTNKYRGGDLKFQAVGKNDKNSDEFASDLNIYLYENGYLDTTTRFFQNEFKYLRIRFDFKDVKFIKVDNIAKLESTMEIQVFDFVDKKPKIIYPVKAESLWVPGQAFYSGNVSSLISSSCLDAIYQFLLDKDQLKKMKELNTIALSEHKTLENIVIDSVYTHKQKLSDVAQAVFTVVTPKGHGSCCLISKNGYILSNYHVVLNDTTKCRVIINGEKKLPYSIIRVYPEHDLALIKVDYNFEKAISIKSEGSEIGEEVYAIGTPADVELGQSISKGIISGFRKFDNVKYIQTDVKINPGNSGGALINTNGELVGIISAKLVGNGAEGLGFAIPIEQAIKYIKLELH